MLNFDDTSVFVLSIKIKPDMLSVIIKETEILSTVSPIAIMLNVDVLNVVAPFQQRGDLEEVMIVQGSLTLLYFPTLCNKLECLSLADTYALL